MRLVALALAAVPVLLLARLLPADGVGLALRLAAATVLLLAPGALAARALGCGGPAATVVWSLTALFAALAVMFAAGASLALALWLLLALGVVGAAACALRRPEALRLGLPGGSAVALAGLAFGFALWHVAGNAEGDALFHLGRVRKLLELDALSLEAVGEFRDGGLHPGYAFPLWHGFVAAIARLADVEPELVLRHEPTVLAPLAFLVVYEAGVRLFRSAWAGVAVLLAQVAFTALAAGHGGAYTSLALPATTARQLLVPAALALFFTAVGRPSPAALASVAAAGLVVALVHPTYAVFLAIPLAGFALVRALVARADVREALAALAALIVPAALVALWLLPVVRETASHTPSAGELDRALAKYPGQVELLSDDRYRLSPELFARGGAVAVAALVCIPLAVLASRRRWAAYVLGGSLALFAVLLVPFVFPLFADAVSLSQARRAAGFLPLAFALAGGAAVLTRLLGFAAVPVALGAGILLQWAYPGDFGYRLDDGGPRLVTWIAAVAAALAVAVAAVLRRPGRFEVGDVRVALAAAAFVLPVAVHGFREWTPRSQVRPHALTPGLVSAIRDVVPERDVVLSDVETSYRIAAYAPVYVAAAPPAHVADTESNRPRERRRDMAEFLRSGDLAIARRYDARWIVVDRERFRPPLSLAAAYADDEYALYEVGTRRRAT